MKARPHPMVFCLLLAGLLPSCAPEAGREGAHQPTDPSGTGAPISPDFPFESHYLEVEGSRLHYLDEGEGQPLLFLHGNPTWSYGWRNIIPHVTPVARAIAPDFIGMGRSDKPPIEYRFLDHARYLDDFIEQLELRNITLMMHDWGAALGFYYAMRHPDNVKGLAFMEPAAFMSVPSWEDYPPDKRERIRSWRSEAGWESIVNRNSFIEKSLPGAVVRRLSEEEMNYYREPFRDPASRKPIWRWPNEIPIAGEPAEVARIVDQYNAWLQETELPKLLFYAEPGRIMNPELLEWSRANLKNLTLVHIGEGIHHLHEDNPHMIGARLAEWFAGLEGSK